MHMDPSLIFQSKFTPPISILVPAHNEQATIVQSIRSFSLTHYPQFEIIIINDGSSDQTLEVLKKEFGLEQIPTVLPNHIPTKKIKGLYVSKHNNNIMLIDKEIGGKADALNAGINASKYPLFCSVDADSILDENGLLKVAIPFIENPREMVATGGMVRLSNGCEAQSGRIVKINLPIKALPLFQMIEYFRAFLFDRVAFSRLKSLLIISGAFGLFNKNTVISVGGYQTDIVGEDMELVLRLHQILKERKQKYQIQFVPDPVCWTEGPETVPDLKKQRDRWHRGMAESMFSHIKMLMRPRYGVIGIFTFPYFFFFELFGPVIEILAYLSISICFVLGIIDINFLITFLILSILFSIILSVSALILEEYSYHKYFGINDILRLLLYAILSNIGYQQLNSFFKTIALFNYFRGKKEWGTLQRRSFSK